jgi:ribosomal protein S18 acetylase RimI-like enzyme
MMRPLKIRPATAADAMELTALAHRAKASWGYPADWIAAWRNDLTMTADYLAARRAFVAEHDGRAAGVLVFEEHADHWSVEHLWIDPDLQRRGIGRLLVRHGLALATRDRAARVHVLSDPYAEPFYLRMGAVRIGVEPAPMPGAPERVLPVLEFRLEV